MRLKFFFLLLITLQFSAFSFAQKKKVKIKKDVVKVDGQPVFKLERDIRLNLVNLKNLEGKKLAIFKIDDYYDADQIGSANPKGRVTYYSVTFLDTAMHKCELDPATRKGLAKEIIEFKLVKNGQLNETAVEQFVKIFGKKYSKQRKSSTTIIINH